MTGREHGQEPPRRGPCPTCGAVGMRGSRGTHEDFKICADPYHGPVPEPYASDGRTFGPVAEHGPSEKAKIAAQLDEPWSDPVRTGARPGRESVGMTYMCLTPDCPERRRGACDEPSFCSACLAELTGVYLGPGVELSDVLREKVPGAHPPRPAIRAWVCDACGELMSRADGSRDAHCAGAPAMGNAHERRRMRAITVREFSESSSPDREGETHGE